METPTTNERFQDEFKTKDFTFDVKCGKCGSSDVDMRFHAGMVYSEYTSESACLEVWCKKCDNKSYAN